MIDLLHTVLPHTREGSIPLLSFIHPLSQFMALLCFAAHCMQCELKC